VDTGLLILRIVFGGLNCFGRGAKKLFRWFSGHSLDGTGGFFHSLGFRPGKRMAAVAGLSEVGPGRRPAGCARPCTGSLPAFDPVLHPAATLTTCSAGKYCRTRQQRSRSVSTRRSA
jgi:hypothetical protein